MNKRTISAIAGAVLAMSASATVVEEFWSLEEGATPGTLDLSPTIDPSHTLWKYNNFSLCIPAFVGVPGNQTFTSARNTSALEAWDGDHRSALISSNDELRRAAMLENDFTFEGWFRLHTTNGVWLFGTRNSSGWYFQYSRGTFSFAPGSLYTVANVSAQKMYDEWNHIALVWHHEGGDNGFGYCELYINHERAGSLSLPEAPTFTAKDSFYFGGRGNNYAGTFHGGNFAVDCVRFTGAALGPDEFLQGRTLSDDYTPVADPDTVAFWRLDENKNGGSGVTFANEISGSGVLIDDDTSTMVDPAVGRIPNMSWYPWAKYGESNFDVRGRRRSGGRFYTSGDVNVTKYLSLTNDFTVEGWFKMESVPTSGWRILLGVHTYAAPRWWVILRPAKYYIMVHYGNNQYSIADNLGFTNGTVNCEMQESDAGKWRHHAIIFEKNKGPYGTFSLYIDGVYRGCRAMASAFPATASESLATQSFDIGGRSGRQNSYSGLGVDLVRVTRRALQPSEFLNAEVACSAPAVSVTNRFVAAKTTDKVATSNEETAYATCNRPFTAEGWVRVREQDVYPQTLAACASETNGWTLAATSANTVKLSVIKRSEATVAEETFTLPKDDFTWWKYVTITHDFGLWKVYVNAELVGTLTNSAAFFTSDVAAATKLMFGSDTGKVQHEQWRIVNEVLLPVDFDYVERPRRRGTAILVR